MSTTTQASSRGNEHGGIWRFIDKKVNPIIGGKPNYSEPKMLSFAEADEAEFQKLRRQEETGFPQEFRNCTIDDFDFKKYKANVSRLEKMAHGYIDRWEACRTMGKAFYLWSRTPGSGKTRLACSIAATISDTYGIKVRFITAPDYLAYIKDNFNAERGTPDRSEVYRKCDFLILDDIGSQTSGEWQRQEMFRLIDERYRNKRPTFFTSNLPISGLNVDARTKDRIRGMVTEIQQPEESIRSKQAQQEQDEFVQLVLGL